MANIHVERYPHWTNNSSYLWGWLFVKNNSHRCMELEFYSDSEDPWYNDINISNIKKLSVPSKAAYALELPYGLQFDIKYFSDCVYNAYNEKAIEVANQNNIGINSYIIKRCSVGKTTILAQNSKIANITNLHNYDILIEHPKYDPINLRPGETFITDCLSNLIGELVIDGEMAAKYFPIQAGNDWFNFWIDNELFIGNDIEHHEHDLKIYKKQSYLTTYSCNNCDYPQLKGKLSFGSGPYLTIEPTNIIYCGAVVTGIENKKELFIRFDNNTSDALSAKIIFNNNTTDLYCDGKHGTQEYPILQTPYHYNEAFYSALCSCSNCYRQKGKLNVTWTGQGILIPEFDVNNGVEIYCCSYDFDGPRLRLILDESGIDLEKNFAIHYTVEWPGYDDAYNDIIIYEDFEIQKNQLNKVDGTENDIYYIHLHPGEGNLDAESVEKTYSWIGETLFLVKASKFEQAYIEDYCTSGTYSHIISINKPGVYLTPGTTFTYN